MKAKIVVGLGYGDEGKGITTDYLCSKNPDSVVVRFSGGHQAAHNVVIDGVSHIHRSFGSGALRGIPSYFSEHCCIYLPNMMREYMILLEKAAVAPRLVVHPLAKMTTAYDIAYNQVRESRLKHGSVGLGIGATFSRHEGHYKIHAADILNGRVLNIKLSQVFEYYKHKLQVEGYTEDEIDRYYAISAIQGREMNWALARHNVEIRPYSYLKNYDNIIFEGSQGILLDMDIGLFPNVTYANTTSKNAIAICKEMGIADICTYYVTRCYQTRHGNGHMQESSPITLINNEEETNTTHEWQGSLRVAELSYTELNYALRCDDAFAYDTDKRMVITCLDQRPTFVFNETLFPQMREFILSYSSDCKDFAFNMNPHFKNLKG